MFVDQNNERTRGDNSGTAKMENGVLKIENSTGYNAENTEYEWFVPNEEVPEEVPSTEPEPEQHAVTPASTEEEAINNQQHESNTNEEELSAETVEVPKPVQEDAEEVLTKEKILKEFRKFNIDLSPKVRTD